MTTPRYQVLDLDVRTRRFLESAGIGPGMRILDIGSGGGDVALLAADLVGASGEVVGIDRNEQVLEIASRKAREARAPVRFVAADILDLPEDLGHFDAAIGRRVLMYVPDPRAALRSIARRVEPGGVIAFEELQLSMVPMASAPLPLHQEVHRWLGLMLASENAHRDLGMRLAPLMESLGMEIRAATAEAVLETSSLHFDLGWRLEFMKPRLLAAGVDESALDSLHDIDERLVAERRENAAAFIGQVAFRVAAEVPRQ